MILRASNIIILFLLTLSGIKPSAGKGTTELANESYFFRIYFTDKGTQTLSSFAPEDLFTASAIARRTKNGITTLGMDDLPVFQDYIDSIKQYGLSLRCRSRWMNSALFATDNAADTTHLSSLSFISSIKTVKTPAKSAGSSINKQLTTSASSALLSPVDAVNGTLLHDVGYTGTGITIAVIDAGFANADIVESLRDMRKSNGILATYDFISRSSYVYDYSLHGTAVLTVLAGDSDEISGSAPGASFLLLRSEDDASEYPVEEDYWVAAAEYADSAGADIISSSLGYYSFDDPAMDYDFSAADGNTAIITCAADIAASKGILVVVSAGNERTNEWKRICFPSDGDSVLCIGAVNPDMTIASFSSAGYSYDGRVKPDMVAPGVYVPAQYYYGTTSYVNGTSVACPVVSGMCASLMQAMPDATAKEIADAVKESCDRYYSPDSLYGYGLPDFASILNLTDNQDICSPETVITVGPNPFANSVTLFFSESPGNLSLTLINSSGQTIRNISYASYTASEYTLAGLESLASGVYLLKIKTVRHEETVKLIKMKP